MPDNAKAEDMMGVVLFGEPAEAVSQEQVVSALWAADMPSDLGEHLNARSWFIRATRGLARTLPEIVLRDNCAEDAAGIKFAFITRTVVADDPRYSAVCEIFFDKKSQQIFVHKTPPGMTTQAVLDEATALLGNAKTTWEPSDINQLVKRFLGGECRQVPLRPGVSFIAKQHESLAKQVQTFYEKLGVPFYRLDVGYTPRLARQVHEAIVRDLRSQVGAVLAEIRDLKASGELTKKKSRSRLKELRKALKDYQDLARSSRFDLDDMIADAGAAGQALVVASLPPDAVFAAIQGGGTSIPEAIADLYACEAEIDLGSLHTPEQSLPKLDLGSMPSEAVSTPAPAANASGVVADLGS